MKSLFVFTSVFLGTGLLASTTSHTHSRNTTFKRINSATGPVGAVSIVIDKTDYELSIYDSKGWYATYPVVFGNNTLEDKKMEGDKNTPEGNFKINSKRIHDKWYRFMAIDYPTKESYEKFNRRKKRGEIPANARIGGSIGIHGTWPREDFMIDGYKNWTLGCISMKNGDVAEIYAYCPVGTQVRIKK